MRWPGSAPRSTSTTSRRWPSTSAAGWSSEHRLALDARAVSGRGGARPAGRAGPRDRWPTSRAADIEPVGLTVGVAGLVDRERDVLTLGPNLGWRDVPVGDLLRARLGAAYPITVENEGNLAAHRRGHARRPEPPGHPGDLRRGRRRRRHRRRRPAAARPPGVRRRVRPHDRRAAGPPLRLRPGRAAGRRSSGCGRCSTLAADPDDPVRDPALAIDDRLAELNRRADLGDTRTLAALDQVGGWVGVGAAMLANALNPAAIVLSGYFAAVGHHMRPAIEEPAPGRRARAGGGRHPGRAVDARASPPPSAGAPASPSTPSSPTRPGSSAVPSPKEPLR